MHKIQWQIAARQQPISSFRFVFFNLQAANCQAFYSFHITSGHGIESFACVSAALTARRCCYSKHTCKMNTDLSQQKKEKKNAS